MSASDKKKLRKEQTAAFTTEKQRNEQKKQKKQTAYTVTFVVAMALVVVIFLGTVLSTPVTNLLIKSSHAATINGYDIGGQQFNYFYMDAISSFFNNIKQQYGSYAPMMLQMYGFDPNTPVGDQVYNKEKGESWADYFTASALESAKWTYSMYDKAMKDEKFSLTEDQQKGLASIEESIKKQAESAGVSANKYIKNLYGGSASFKSYLEYYKVTVIASSYASKYFEDLEFSDDDLRGYEKDKYHEYSSYSYATYTLNVSEYLTGGKKVTDEDGKTTTVYSDEEKKAAQEAALADAKKLAENKDITTVPGLDKAIKELEKQKDKSSTEISSTLFTSLRLSNEEMEKWLISSDRKEGDLSYFTNTTKTDDVETVSSYTVVLFINCHENKSYEGNVLHLLVAFEGGTKDSNGNTTYSDAEKKKARLEAERLLAEYNEGSKTKEAFIELLKKHTDDVDAKGNPNNGGLYENITPASKYVQEFKDWAYADHKPGDTGIIETDYGYHIMYYVEDGEHTYRDLLIENDMKNEAYEKWEEEVLKAVKVEDGKPYVNKKFVVPSSYYSSTY